MIRKIEARFLECYAHTTVVTLLSETTSVFARLVNECDTEKVVDRKEMTSLLEPLCKIGRGLMRRAVMYETLDVKEKCAFCFAVYHQFEIRTLVESMMEHRRHTLKIGGRLRDGKAALSLL